MKNTGIIKKRKRGRPTLAASINPDKILKVALKVFAEFGFGGAKISTISKQANVDDLAYADYIKDTQNIIKLFKDMDVVTFAKTSLRHGIHYNAKHPELYQIIFHEMTLKSERSDWIIKNVLEPHAKRVYLLHKNLKKEGLVKDLPLPNLVSIYIGAMNTIFVLHNQIQAQFGVDAFDDDQIDKHSDVVIDIMFNGMLTK